jgi:hypothetical protein
MPFDSPQPATLINRFSCRFSLRTLLAAMTLVAIACGYFASAANLVQHRRELLQACDDRRAFVILSHEDNPSGIKDLRALTIYSLFERWTKPATWTADAPTIVALRNRRKLSLVRRWLGDRRVDNIFLTDSALLPRYSRAFQEAQIVLDPSIEPAIAASQRGAAAAIIWRRAAGSSRF